MVQKKCIKCNKNITRKLPGLECSRCDKIVHADPTCAKLSNKQINTLRNSPGIEWSCEDCLKNMSRRSSYIIPDNDEDDDDSEPNSVINTMDTRKLVQDISRELKKTFKEEISSLGASLEFLGDQISAMEQSIKNQDSVIKKLEHKNEDLQNKNKNLELRVAVLEQGLRNHEQKSLSTSLEIAGLPDIPPKDVKQTLLTVAAELDMDDNDILSYQRIPGNRDKPTSILVEMKTKPVCKQWIDASKQKCITAGKIFLDIPKEKANNRIYIREALTKYVKTLLYNAKLELNKSFQFIWCKDGNVCVRKTNNSKIYYIRSLQDIKQLSQARLSY